MFLIPHTNQCSGHAQPVALRSKRTLHEIVNREFLADLGRPRYCRLDVGGDPGSILDGLSASGPLASGAGTTAPGSASAASAKDT